MESPVLEFLMYLVNQCIKKCEVDPEKTTVAEFLEIIQRADTPVGF